MDFARVFNNALPMLLEGLGKTVLVSIISIIIGFVLGLFVCFMVRSRSRVLRGIAKAYVWCVRGTPMMIQALIIFFGVPQIIRLAFPSFSIDQTTAGIITLSLNAAAYMSEIFRGAIAAVDIGQVEASRSLGLSKTTTMIKVVLPQAFKICAPSLVNQFIITIKDSSLLSVIGLSELLNQAKAFAGSTYVYFETYIVVAVMYLIVLSILMVLSQRVEKRLRNEK